MGPVQDRYLSIMIGRDVWAGSHGEHGESLANVGVAPPDAGDAEPGLTALREQPFVLAFLLLVLGIGELVEAIGDDQATARRELATLGAEVVDGPSVLARPTP